LKPVQWPVTKNTPNGHKRFFADGGFFTPNRKAKLLAITSRPPANQTNKRYPLVLNTGRLRDQWHTMTRSALSPRLNQHRPEPFVEINPVDAQTYGLEQGHIAHLLSQWGQMYARVQITDNQRVGDVFVPMHWTEQYATNGRMGALVNPVVDPFSGQPESKHTPIAIRPFQASWHGFILSRHALDSLRSNKMAIEYQVTVNGDGYYRYELAATQTPENWPESLGAMIPGTNFEQQHYLDPNLGIYRTAAYQPHPENGGSSDSSDSSKSGESQLSFVACIAPQPEISLLPERAWLSSLFAKSTLNADERIALLSGLPTIGTEDVGKQVCACFNVGEKTIIKAITDNGLSTPQQVGTCCKAGTNCGSCVPEIKALIATHKNEPALDAREA
jgi:assimilatory nitrate reductase catalytic subunit